MVWVQKQRPKLHKLSKRPQKWMTPPPIKRDSTKQLIQEMQALKADVAPLRQEVHNRGKEFSHEGEGPVEGD